MARERQRTELGMFEKANRAMIKTTTPTDDANCVSMHGDCIDAWLVCVCIQCTLMEAERMAF